MYDDLSIEQLYSVIASQTIQDLPDGWQEAMVVAEIESDDNGVNYGSFIDALGESHWIDFQSAHLIYYAFKRIREIVQKPDEPMWIKAIFTLQNTGKFTLDFSYPELDNGSSEAS